MFANRNSLPTLPRHSRGMSLIEVIIVIVLIGAVLTFLTSRVLGGADRAKVNLANSQVQSLAGKIEQYDLDNSGLPPDLQALLTQPADAPTWLGPYAKSDEIKEDRKSVVEGQSVSVRVDLGGRRIIKKKRQ